MRDRKYPERLYAEFFLGIDDLSLLCVIIGISLGDPQIHDYKIGKDELNEWTILAKNPPDLSQYLGHNTIFILGIKRRKNHDIES